MSDRQTWWLFRIALTILGILNILVTIYLYYQLYLALDNSLGEAI
jgi:hypothetical protein